MALRVSFRFMERAARLRGPAPTPLSCFLSPEIAQQPVCVGDNIRFDTVPGSPWFVVAHRYWEFGSTTTLTIWLDAPED